MKLKLNIFLLFILATCIFSMCKSDRNSNSLKESSENMKPVVNHNHDLIKVTQQDYSNSSIDAIVESIYKTDNAKTYTNNDIKTAKKLNKKGSYLNKQRKFYEAIITFLKSIKTFPTASAYFNLGNSCLNMFDKIKDFIMYNENPHRKKRRLKYRYKKILTQGSMSKIF